MENKSALSAVWLIYLFLSIFTDQSKGPSIGRSANNSFGLILTMLKV